MFLRFTLAAAVIGAAVSASGAENSAPVVRGTAGLVGVPFEAANQGPGDIVCSAALAHWYSSDLGRAVPGQHIAALLWYDPKDGTMDLLNGSEDRMPVQSLWCGLAGRGWATRASVSMERIAGRTPGPIHIVCAPQGERLSCR